MARPQKKGLDYFPIDTHMDKTDDDIEMLEAKYGNDGFTTLIKIYMKIYYEDGYYLMVHEKSTLLLAKRSNIGIELFENIISDLINWGIFDKVKFEKYNILTSKRVQETYIEAVKKRKEVTMHKEYIHKEIHINDNINLINVGINPQSKLDNIKEDNTKIDNTKEKKDEKTFSFEKFSKFHYDFFIGFVELIKINNPNARYPKENTKNYYNWLNALRLLEETDGYDKDTIYNVTKWCQQDNFWKGNILSIPKLREKFNQLLVQSRNKNNDSMSDSLRRWANE